MNIDLSPIARDLKISQDKFEKAVSLLDEGNTIPFITRFRKDETGGLNEKQILSIQQRVAKARAIEDRRNYVLKTIESQNKLTDDLREQITSASTLRQIEDAYLPFKPKKQSHATTAKQAGLEPFADDILAGKQDAADLAAQALNYVRVDKNVNSSEEVFEGVGFIIAEKFSDDGALRADLRKIFWETGKLTCALVPVAAEANGDGENKSEPQAGDSKPSTIDPANVDPANDSTPAEATAPPADVNSAASPETNAAADLPGSSGIVTESDSAAESETASVSEESGAVIEPDAGEASGRPVEPQDQSNTDASNTDASNTDASNTDASSSDASSSDASSSDTESTVDGSAAQKTGAESAEVPTTSTPANAENVDQAPASNAEVTATSEVTDTPAKESESGKPETSTAKMSAATTEPAKKKKKRKKKKKKKANDPFSDFKDFSAPLGKVPHHRMLAINRGERSGRLRVRIVADEQKMLELAKSALVPADHNHAEFLKNCVTDAMSRLVLPSLEREARRELTENAERHAVEVFSSNLKHLLLQPPTYGKTILAIDPGFKRGCSVVVIDPSGKFIESAHVFVVGNKSRREESVEKLAALLEKHHVDLIAIGNGTACRDTEQMVSTLIAERSKNPELRYVIVNEAGASVYSTSEIGREEFPDASPNVRSAISIGRRLIDPLSELVKIAPASIGVGLYQHDVKAKHLSESLDQTVEFCVNRVGVNVNTASPSLLKYVSGLNQLTAHRIYEYRQEHGPFSNREALKGVTGFGQATFVQAAGFLKVLGGDQPLDSTSIHPESYGIATAIIERAKAEPEILFPKSKEKPEPAATENAKPETLPVAEAGQETVPSATLESEPGSNATAENEATSAQPLETESKPVADEVKPVEPQAGGGAAEVEAESAAKVETPAEGGDAVESGVNVADESAPSQDAIADVAEKTEEPTSQTPAESKPVADGGVARETAVSPESSATAAGPPPKLSDEERKARVEIVARIKDIDQRKLAEEFSVGNLLVKDIVNNLIRPRRDPREGVSRPIYRKGIIKVDDLKPGMMLDGQVVNVVDFGVFVDIGLGESCLVHVSQLSRRYVMDPHQLFSVGEVLKVWVKEIEPERRRVKLTAVNPQAPKEPRRKRSDRKPAARREKSADRGTRKKTHQRHGGKASTTTTRATRTRRTPKPVKPITKDMLEGKKPMTSFSDLLQFVEKQTDEKKKKNK